MSRPSIAARCIEIAHGFRIGREASAHARLPDVLTELEALFRDGVLDPQRAAPVLEIMLDALSRGDILLVADVLEHVLAPSLSDAAPPEIP